MPTHTSKGGSSELQFLGSWGGQQEGQKQNKPKGSAECLLIQDNPPMKNNLPSQGPPTLSKQAYLTILLTDLCGSQAPFCDSEQQPTTRNPDPIPHSYQPHPSPATPSLPRNPVPWDVPRNATLPITQLVACAYTTYLPPSPPGPLGSEERVLTL